MPLPEPTNPGIVAERMGSPRKVIFISDVDGGLEPDLSNLRDDQLSVILETFLGL
jgi:hypothetical protein